MSVGSLYPLLLLGNNSFKKFPWYEEFLEASFSMRSVSYQRGTVGLYVYRCIPLSLLDNGEVNTFLRQEGIVGGVFSMGSMSYKRKVGNYFFIGLLVFV
jgi:hypothetical protein